VIISHRHRFVFFAVPKTGTHSVRRALRPHLGPEDQEQVGLFEKKQFSFHDLAHFKSGHVSVRQIAPILGPERMAGYFKFAFVRNPYDRFVSFSAFMGRESGQFQRSPGEFMKYLLTEHVKTNPLLMRPQIEFLGDAEGRIAMDFVGRCEDMQAGYDQACARIGIETAPLDQVNSSVRSDYRGYYDKELIELVATLYRRDLELFGYQF